MTWLFSAPKEHAVIAILREPAPNKRVIASLAKQGVAISIRMLGIAYSDRDRDRDLVRMQRSDVNYGMF
jgi:hypothetical protein